MDVKLLEAFRAVVSNHSVTKAAKVLKLTQPAVSAQLARLEASVGFSLFTRQGGRLALTQEGRAFHDEVKHALGTLQRLNNVAEGIRKGQAGRLVIASHPSASISLVPGLVADFLKIHPDVHVHMINRTSEEIRSFFPGMPIDIGIAELPVDIGGVEVKKYSIDCVAILPPRHPACRNEVVTPADLADHPFITISAHRLISHTIKEAFSDKGVALKIVAEVDFFSSICAVVAHGGGVSIVDAWSAEMFQCMGLEVRRFDPSVPYEIGVMKDANRPLSTLASAFIEVLDNRLKMR